MALKASAMAAAFILCCQVAAAAEDDPCTRFTWDVSHELAVMKEQPRALIAASNPRSDLSRLGLNTPYEITLADQSAATFVITPGKPTLPDGAHAGILRFRTDQAGRYRISITSGHWIDVIDGTAMLKSRDFQGARGCERPRKIVEYDLPGGRELTLQLSGAADASILLAVTTVAK